LSSSSAFTAVMDNADQYLDPKNGTGGNMFSPNAHTSSFWDLDDSSADTSTYSPAAANNKMCFPGSTSLWKTLTSNKKKVASTDISSVGNASDTLVETESCNGVLLGRDLHESAKTHLNRREYDKALQSFEAILSAQIQRFGPVHSAVASAMHNVGVCRQRMQQPALAANLLQEAVQIRKQTLGEKHLEVAVSLSKLGTAQASLKQYDSAFTSIREAIGISKHQLGYRHKTTAQMLCHLACFYFEAGELYAAEATFVDAYDIYRDVFRNLSSAEPPETRDACMAQMTDTLCNIGSIQNRRKRYGDAISTFAEALDLQLGVYGGYDHPLVVATLDNLAYSYSKNKDYAKALSCYQKMFKAQVNTSDNEFTDACLETFRKQVIMYEKLKRHGEAYETAKDTLRLAKTMLPSRQDKKLDELNKIVNGLKKKVTSPTTGVASADAKGATSKKASPAAR